MELALLQEYQPYIVGAVVVILVCSCKSAEFRNWVIRLSIGAVIIGSCYFAFQQIQYKFKSGKEVNPFNSQPETKENAGMKYYRDPGERIRQATE